jgi:molybdenum cofactor cytidylyltransferase
MGTAKQLLPVGGVPLAARAADAALASSASPVVVVLGAEAGAVRLALGARRVIAVENADWRSGVASSIAVGLAALTAAEAGLDAVLVAPCDQPALSAAAIDALATLCRETGRIAATRYGSRMGAPAVFARAHFPLLRQLTGDEGARRVLNSGDARIAALDLPGMDADIDTPADYSAWKPGPRGPGAHSSES